MLWLNAVFITISIHFIKKKMKGAHWPSTKVFKYPIIITKIQNVWGNRRGWYVSLAVPVSSIGRESNGWVKVWHTQTTCHLSSINSKAQVWQKESCSSFFPGSYSILQISPKDSVIYNTVGFTLWIYLGLSPIIGLYLILFYFAYVFMFVFCCLSTPWYFV